MQWFVLRTYRWDHIRYLEISEDFFGNNFTIVKLLTICLFSFRSLPNYLPQRSVPLCPHMITSIAQLWRVSLLQRVQLVMWQHDLHARSSIWKAGKHHRKLKDAFDQVMAHGKLKYVENRWKILGGGFQFLFIVTPTIPYLIFVKWVEPTNDMDKAWTIYVAYIMPYMLVRFVSNSSEMNHTSCWLFFCFGCRTFSMCRCMHS